MAKSKAGGGYRSKNVVEKPVKVGQRAEEIRHQGVAQIGSSLGDKATDHSGRLRNSVEAVRGSPRPTGSPGSFDLGNEVAARTVCKPGGSREVSKSGSQGQHGSVNPGQPRPGANKPIWPGMG
jgi:hypothetical protein